MATVTVTVGRIGTDGGRMGGERVVAVSYPVDEETAGINSAVLAGDATVVFTHDLDDAERLAALRRAEALIAWRPPAEFPPGALRQAPVRFMQLLSAGADQIDFSAIGDGIVIAGNVGAYAKPIAEHVLAMALCLAKRLPQRHAALAAGRFEIGRESLTLDGAVCAILGYGGIGRAAAAAMRAVGARIHAVTRSGQADGPAEFAGTLADLPEVLAAADVTVIGLPLTRATRGLIGARELALMKPTAILINVARAAIVDEAALYEHLRASPDFGAGIDVWWDEPARGQEFAPRYPFLSLPNVIGSPHNSPGVPGTQASAARQAAENVRRYLRGEPPAGVMRREEYLAPSR
jgi:phosphoglycerate dehydrogenase-like enzyme